MNQNCDSCGARLSPEAEVCDLCGSPTGYIKPDSPETGPVSDDLGATAGVAPDAARDEEDEATVVNGERICPDCDHNNPESAVFCNQCGARIDGRQVKSNINTRTKAPVKSDKKAVSRSASSSQTSTTGVADKDSESSAVGKQVIVVVSGALLLVMALYIITTLSDSGAESSATQLPVGAVLDEPLARQWVDRENTIKEEISQAEGIVKIAARRRLIDLYFTADRLDLAASETVVIAETTNEEEDWVVAGNLYFDWMQRQPDAQRAGWAQEAVSAYQKSLELDPANLDVRTDMAIAYMYDPQNSMLAIQETNKVLSEDSLHIQANFNRGIMLSQINRTSQAIEQFEKVKRILGDEANPVYLRAVDAINRLSTPAVGN